MSVLYCALFFFQMNLKYTILKQDIYVYKVLTSNVFLKSVIPLTAMAVDSIFGSHICLGALF